MGCGVRAEGAMRGVGAGERAETAESSGAERGEGSRERQGQRDSIADGTALRCGRVGSRHFQKLDIVRYRASLYMWASLFPPPLGGWGASLP